MIIEVYADESCKDDHQYLVLGAILIERRHVNQFHEAFEPLWKLKGCYDELKWQKTNRYRLDGYTQIANKFAELNNGDICHFRSVIIDQHQYNHKKFNQGNPEIGISKFVYQLLVNNIGRVYGRDDTFHVYLDEKCTSTPLLQFQRLLNNGITHRYGYGHNPFQRVHAINSKKSLPMQINDLVLGAVATRRNGHHKKPDYRPEKRALSDLILKNAKISDITRNSQYGREQFNTWHMRMGK